MNTSALTVPLLLLAVAVYFYFRRRIIAWIPESVRSKSPLILGCFGVFLFIALIVNSVLTVRHQLTDQDVNDIPTVALPSMPFEKEMSDVSDLDVHLVMIETKGSMVSSDWKVTQWRAPAEEGFDKLPLVDEWEVSLGGLNLTDQHLEYHYEISRPHSNSSGASSMRSSACFSPQWIEGLGIDRSYEFVLIGMPKFRGESKIYFFLSKKEDPLKDWAIDGSSKEMGAIQIAEFLSEISTLQDRLSMTAPEGLNWLDSLGVSFFVLVVIFSLISGLFPWSKGAVTIGLMVACVFVTIALDRWSVDYAATVAADGSKQPMTRYLAMQQLRSSYFWKHQAERAFQSANTEGFSSDMLEMVRPQGR